MNIYPVGVPVTVTIPFVDLNGDPVTPTGVTVEVTDENGTVVVPSASVSFAPGDTDIDFTVTGAANTLAVGVASGLRVVTASLAMATGSYTSEVIYQLRAGDALVVPTSSFQTYNMALLGAASLPRNALVEWNAASRFERETALMEAYRRLTRIGYLMREHDWLEQDRLPNITGIEEAVSPRMWPDMTLDNYLLLPARFRTALCQAQIVEANEVLNAVDPNDKRRIGILSESIGESSMMFRTGKPLDMGLSHASLQYLTGYISTRMTMTRT